jgi:thioredoxin-like negative regulator of GroEL
MRGRGIQERLVREDPSRQDVLVILRHILRVSGDVPHDAVQRRVAAVVPEAEASMASAAEQLIQQGRAQGIEQGIEQGRVLALRETLARQLAARFGDVSEQARRRIEEAGSAELDRWVEAVVRAARPEDVFAS